MLSHILEIYFRPIQIQYIYIYFCLFEDPMQLSPVTILGWSPIFDFDIEGQRAECFLQTLFLAFVNRHVISDCVTTQVTHQHGSIIHKQGTSFRQFLLTSKDSFPNAGEHPRSIPQKKTFLHPKANHVRPKGFCHVLTQDVQRRDGKAGYYISEKAVCIKGNSNTALCR